MLPILHLNGYKIANPTVLARIPHEELRALLEGYGYEPLFVEGDDPAAMHQLMAATLDDGARRDRARSRRRARDGRRRERPRWPMIVLRTPKGWTGPKEVDGKPAEGTLRSHQVPLADLAHEPRAPRASSRSGCAATGPRSCSTSDGALRRRARRAGARRATRRMGANPHANGGLLLRDLRAARLPRLRRRGAGARPRRIGEATRVLGALPARRRCAATRDAQLPDLRPRRDGLEPARRRVRGHRPRTGTAEIAARPTSTWRPTAG